VAFLSPLATSALFPLSLSAFFVKQSSANAGLLHHDEEAHYSARGVQSSLLSIRTCGGSKLVALDASISWKPKMKRESSGCNTYHRPWPTDFESHTRFPHHEGLGITREV